MRNTVASSSRRPARNGHVESDPIENDDEDERPVKPHGRRRAAADEEEDEDEKEDGWTIDTFVDQPIAKSNAVIIMVSYRPTSFIWFSS